MDIPELEEHELIQMLETPGRPLAVLLVSPFCGTCRAAGRMLEVAAHLLPEEVMVAKADVNRMPVFVRSRRIVSVPALLVARGDRTAPESVLYAIGSVENILIYIRRGIAT